GSLRTAGPDPVHWLNQQSAAPDSDQETRTRVTRVTSPRLAGITALGALALTLTACGGGSQAADGSGSGDGLSGTIAGSGASSQENAVQGWVAGFMEANPGASVSYDRSEERRVGKERRPRYARPKEHS